MDLSIKTAKANSSQIILANDPDADRLAVAEVREDGSYKLFSGNEVGALWAGGLWSCTKCENPTAMLVTV